jgi:membrane carboxypeptidase/penicillin-binding protein PbpC
MIIQFEIQDDPYGDTIQGIRKALHYTIGTQAGEMSEGEFQNLLAIEELVRERDNA